MAEATQAGEAVIEPEVDRLMHQLPGFHAGVGQQLGRAEKSL